MLSAMRDFVERIHLPPKCTHLEGLSFSGLITPGNYPIPPTMNVGGIHRICGKGIHKHRIIDSYRLLTCHEHCWNA